MLKKLGYFLKVLRISPEIAFKKVYDSAVSNLKKNRERLNDLEHSTFFKVNIEQKTTNRISELKTHNPQFKTSIFEKQDFIKDLKVSNSYFKFPDVGILERRKEIIAEISNNILNHNFNLLGSGWIRVQHGCEISGLEGYKYTSVECFTEWFNWLKKHINHNNLEHCKHISDLISPDYIPIDWQLDFKSGFRWDETEWSHDIKYGNVQGADIKVPWELGRMQHLVWLAYAYKLQITNYELRIEDDNKQETINNHQLPITEDGQTDNGQRITDNKHVFEFRNEILDFIASNPPRFGVQWMCSMDVGLRAVNWLVAYDLFKSSGVEFDEEFENSFAESIFVHGLHISQNLEWSSGLRGNHYFTNICSLLFISSYLGTNELTNTWLAFALQELINETEEQFLSDGGNFEASIPYHFYGFETLLYSLGVIITLGKDKTENLKNLKYIDSVVAKKIIQYEQQKFKIGNDGSIILPNQFWQRLKSISEFTLSIIDSSGKSFQIGDNDSGKFLKLTPYLENYENSINSIIPISILAGFLHYDFSNPWLKSLIEKDALFEYLIMKSIIPISSNENHLNELKAVLNDADLAMNDDKINSIPFNSFGIFLNKTKKYFFAIRCGSVGQRGKGGHSHNDNLSFCMIVDGNEIFVDPGTYLYTPIPKLRNQYRSTAFHNTLELVGSEQNDWNTQSKDDLFWLSSNRAKPQVLDLSDKIFVGEHKGFRKPHKRIITFNDNFIDGVDMCDAFGLKKVHFHLAPKVVVSQSDKNTLSLSCDKIKMTFICDNAEIKVNDYFYSPSYGIKQQSQKISLLSNRYKFNWKMVFEEG